MSLEAYDHYWSSARGLGDEQRRRRMAKIRDKAGVDNGFGSGDAPIGAQAPVVQDNMLQQLARRAAGRIDDWESLIDPTLSYGENLATVKRKGGKSIDSTKERQRRKAIDANDDRQRRRAKSAIRENLDAIDAGEKDRLIADIRAEYGDSFAENAIAEARALETPTPDAPIADRSIPETPKIPETPAEPATTETPESPTPVGSQLSGKYRGFCGAVRLILAYLAVSLLSAARDAGSIARTAALIAELELRQAIAEYRPLIDALAIHARYYRVRLTHDRPTN